MKSLGRKKGSRLRLRYVFGSSTTFHRRKECICEKQMSSSKCSFTCICGIFLPLNPSTSTVYARSAFYPSLRFTLSLQSAFYPWSTVCSLRFTPTDIIICLELTLSFLIGRKRTVNFRNQHPGCHLAADYTIIVSRTLKVTGNHVMYDHDA